VVVHCVSDEFAQVLKRLETGSLEQAQDWLEMVEWRLLQTCREAGQSATAPSCRQALRLVAAIREAFTAAEAERARTLLVNAMTRFTPAA
jgi:hypothetical protein